ncbi:hypothetical protein ABFS82_11G050200 [Erythranthe guttata]
MDAAAGVSAATVKSIFVYPIKSCRGISLPQAPISSTGFRYDREWLIVNSKGRAYTQRVEPKLALVAVELPIEAFSLDWEPNHHSYLVITAPGMDALKIPLAKSVEIVNGVSVWEWTGSAVDEGDHAAQWFSNYLGKPSRLVRFHDASEVRIVDPEYVHGYKVMFSDGILVEGCEPFIEDLWTEIKISQSTFQGVKLCSRCKVPTINQETTEAGSEPTDTLITFRSDKVLRPNKKHQKGKVYFGQNMVCLDSINGEEGKRKSIKLGDSVFVLKSVTSAADAAV